MTHHIPHARRLALIIAFVMIMMTALGSFSTVHATLYSAPAAVQTTSVASSNNYTKEYYKVTTDQDNTIKVEGRTAIHTERFCIRLTAHGTSTAVITAFVTPDANGEFAISINTAEGNTEIPTATKGTVATAQDSYDTRPGNRAVEQFGAGTYHLTIARATTAAGANIAPGSNWWKGPLGGSDGYAYKEAVLTVASGQNNNPKVVKYTAAIDNNNKTTNQYEKKSYHDSAYKGSYAKYTDRYLKDMKFVLTCLQTVP